MAIVIPYVKQTWIDGSGGGTPTSAARLGVLEEGILDVSQAPTVSVFHNATQATTNTVDLTLAFNSENWDQAGGASSTQHDTVTNNGRLTALYAGIYSVSATVPWAISATGYRRARIQKNSADTNIEQSNNASTVGVVTTTNVTGLISLGVNDFVTVVVTQSSGGALNVSANAMFQMVRVA